MDNTQEFVTARLSEGVARDTIVQELREQEKHVDAVLTGYVDTLAEQAEPERQRHHSFRLTRE